MKVPTKIGIPLWRERSKMAKKKPKIIRNATLIIRTVNIPADLDNELQEECAKRGMLSVGELILEILEKRSRRNKKKE